MIFSPHDEAINWCVLSTTVFALELPFHVTNAFFTAEDWKIKCQPQQKLPFQIFVRNLCYHVFKHCWYFQSAYLVYSPVLIFFEKENFSIIEKSKNLEIWECAKIFQNFKEQLLLNHIVDCQQCFLKNHTLSSTIYDKGFTRQYYYFFDWL